MSDGRFKDIKNENLRILQEEIKNGASVLRSLPTTVSLSTDLRCNLRCPMCVRRLYDDDEHGNNLVIEDTYFLKFAEQVFPAARILQLNIAGEPLMSVKLDLELELAEHYGLKLDVVTNGTLLGADMDRLNRIVWNAAYISVSLDSPVRRTYEAIRVGADFSQVVKNLMLLRDFRRLMPSDRAPMFIINMVLMKRNLHEVERMIRLVKDIGADCLRIRDLMVLRDAMKPESLEGRGSEVVRVLSKAMDLARRLRVNVSPPPSSGIGFVGDQGNDRYAPLCSSVAMSRPDWCFYLWDRVYIDGNANIFPCCSPTHEVVGSMKTHDFRDIWNNDAYQAMRRMFLGGPAYPVCEKCAASGYLRTIIVPADKQ